MFRFYFNNTLVDNPINWMEFTETIERDVVINGLLPKYNIKLNFSGGGYNYLYSKRLLLGFCNLVSIRIEQKCAGANYESILDGYVFLSDCKFNLNKCYVECDIIDNNYGARIYNNKTISIYFDAPFSKNNADILPCGTKNVKFFVPATGVDVVGLRKVYPVWDCFNYLINWMTDGNVGFESDFFDFQMTFTDNPQRGLVLTTGHILRDRANNVSIKTSFDTLFKEINKKYPIGFTIITKNGKPTIKIENESFFYSSSSGVKIDNISDLYESVNNQLLYSEIGIGGTTATYNPSIHSLPSSIKMMFATESYYYQTECNIDRKLDLVTLYICDSNIIEELVHTNTSNDTYDVDIFLIEVTYSGGIGGNTANKTSLLDSSLTPYYYNSNLINAIIAGNFNIYADLASYINANNEGFLANKTSLYSFPFQGSPYTIGFGGQYIPQFSAEVVVNFENDSVLPAFDAGSNYTDPKYTAPSNGHYYFETNLHCRVATDVIQQFSNIEIIGYLYFKRYNSSNLLIDTYIISYGSLGILNGTFGQSYQAFIHAGNFDIGGSHLFFMEAGDYVQISFKWQSLPFRVTNPQTGLPEYTRAQIVILDLQSTYFKTISVEIDAVNGLLVTGNSLNYNVNKLEFDKPLSKSEYDAIKIDMSKSIIVNHDGATNKTAWIRKSIRTLATGETKWELISNLNNI